MTGKVNLVQFPNVFGFALMHSHVLCCWSRPLQVMHDGCKAGAHGMPRYYDVRSSVYGIALYCYSLVACSWPPHTVQFLLCGHGVALVELLFACTSCGQCWGLSSTACHDGIRVNRHAWVCATSDCYSSVNRVLSLL